MQIYEFHISKIKIYIFLKRLNDIVINFSLHNNRSRSPWFLSNQCLATSYDHSLYYQIGKFTISWKGLIKYHVESWKAHLPSSSSSSDENVWNYLVTQAATWLCISIFTANSVSIGKLRVALLLPLLLQCLVWHFSQTAALNLFIQLCQDNTLRLKLLFIVKT